MAVTTHSHLPYRAGDGKTGVLLIHGFFGSPHEVFPLSECLRQHGFRVSSVLLLGHGRNPEALRGVRWQDWLAAVRQELLDLQQQCAEVVVVGFSMGGLLATLLAKELPIKALILLAPAFHLQVQSLVSRGGFRPTSNVFLPKLSDSNQTWVIRLWEAVRIPLSMVGQFIALQKVARLALNSVQVPSLIIQGTSDQVVHPRSAEIAQHGLGLSQSTLLWFHNSGHILLHGSEQITICETILAWLNQILFSPTTEQLE